MTQRDNQALYIAEFGKNQRPGIGHVVGVEHMKDVAATVKVTDGRYVLRPRLAELGATWCRYGALQNIAKVIGLCRVKKYIQPSIGLLERSVFAWPEETRLVCASYS